MLLAFSQRLAQSLEMSDGDEKLVRDYSASERQTAKRLVAENYDLLIKLARANRNRAKVGETLRTSDLLHESYVKLSEREDWNSKEHFIRSAILAMRAVIVDYARSKLAKKRGGGQNNVSLHDVEYLLPEYSETPEQIVAIGDLLDQLRTDHPRWMRIIDARYFSGMTEEELAKILGVTTRTVRRDWRDARAWLGEKLGVASD